MRIKKDVITQKIAFVGIDSTDHITRKTGLSSFTVYYSLNGGAATVMTTPTVAELDATNMAGDYTLLTDEAGMVSAAGELTVHITASGMDPVTRIVEISTNLENDIYDRVGAPVGASIAADLVVIDNFVDELETRLPAIRAGYLDNLSAGAVALAAALTTHDGKLDTVDGNVDDILLDTGTDGVVVATASKTGYALTATGANLILKDSIFALALADANWDEILTGETHNIATSAGKRVRQIAGIAIHTGTAQAATTTTITLAAAANGGDGVYNRNLLTIIAGTGNGQTRAIVDYNNSTKVCLMSREWRITPDVTSEYQILADDTPLTVDHGLAQAATDTTITIREYASAVDDTYLCNVIIILAGTGRGQARLVGAYNGTTKVITICGDDWATTPDIDSVYALIPYGAACVGCFADSALTQMSTQCDTALADYDGPTRTEATADKDAIIAEVDANETKIDTLQTDSTAIKAKTDNLPSGIVKNVALSDVGAYMVLASDHITAATGKTVTGQISKDGAAFGALTNAVSEVGSGMYKVDLTQAEMNADVIHLKFTETDCDQRIIPVYTT